LIATLLFTITVEGIVVISYSIWRKKPIGPLLSAATLANLITQIFLWFLLNIFFQHYLVTLVLAEVLIWMIESIFLYLFHANEFRLQEAILLSLTMNLTSFALGWYLPI
jgi:hypothetical protein